MFSARLHRACMISSGLLAVATTTGCRHAAIDRGPMPCWQPAPCEAEPGAAHPHLIFNADGGETYPIVERPTDWPETFVSSRWPEETIYRETIRDWQGTFWSDRDRYERRFHAVRRGSSRR